MKIHPLILLLMLIGTFVLGFDGGQLSSRPTITALQNTLDESIQLNERTLASLERIRAATQPATAFSK